MTVFVNTLYKKTTAIVPITPAAAQLTTADFYRDVKKHFHIKGNIKFKDSKTTANIPDAILPAYIEQYRSSAGWSLEIVCDDADDDDDENVDINIRSIMNANILENIKDLDFKIILATYKKSKSLQNSDQVKLAKIVMKNLLENDINLDLGKQDYIYLSNIICQVFSGELKDIYYSKAANKQKPSGKLFDAYNNYRRQLSICGLLKRRTYSVSVKKHNNVDMQDPTALDFVKMNTKTTCEYVEKWKNCLSERLKILADSGESRQDYLQLFPIFELENNIIFELFLADVRALYPTFVGYEVWDNLYKNILEKAAKLKDLMVQTWIQQSTDASEDTIKAVAFLVLPYFFPSTLVRSGTTRKSYKASKLEMQEQFVHHFYTLRDAAFLKILSDNDPKVVFIGDFDYLTPYVVFNNRTYKFDNPAEAIQNCLALHLALDISYPAESTVVWTYVQRYIFEVETINDINNSSLKVVHHQLTAA